MRALDQARAELRQQEAQVAATAAARDILVEQRFSLLSDALTKINFELSQVLRKRSMLWGISTEDLHPRACPFSIH